MANSQGYKDPLYMQKWRAANAAKLRADRRAWYAAHRQTEIANAERYVAEHYDRHLLGCRAYWANRRYPRGRLTRDDVAAIFDRDNRTCHWCGRTKLSGRQLTIDHVRPINRVEYIVTSCHPCNCARKHIPRKTEEELRMVRREGQRRRRALIRSQIQE